MKKLLVCLISCIVACTAMFCFGGCATPPNNPSGGPVEGSLVFNRQSITLDLEESLELTYTTNIENTSDVTWKSSNTNVVTVSDNGVVTAKAVGSAEVTITIGTKTARCSITVYDSYPYPVISLLNTNIRLSVGETFDIDAKVIYRKDVKEVTIAYESENEQVATVSNDGIITAVSVGLIKITLNAVYENMPLQQTLNVVVLSDSLLN